MILDIHLTILVSDLKIWEQYADTSNLKYQQPLDILIPYSCATNPGT